MITTKGIYKNGTIQLLEKINLKENQEVLVIIQPIEDIKEKIEKYFKVIRIGEEVKLNDILKYEDKIWWFS